MKQIIQILLLLMSFSCYGQEFSKSWKDINYAGDNKTYHILDIYLPAVEKPAYPVVVVIYGSAWFGNNLKGSDLKTLGKALLDAGFAVVMPNHSSSADAKFPAQINDIKAVLESQSIDND
jgi:acetyl esterase/lipase